MLRFNLVSRGEGANWQSRVVVSCLLFSMFIEVASGQKLQKSVFGFFSPTADPITDNFF